MKTLHFDCFAGISGDMTLGALVELGVDPELLRGELAKLGLGGWSLDFCREERCGITGTRALVKLDGGDHHDEHEHHEHAHPHEHTHTHEHDHEHAGAHGHNSWKEIRYLIEQSALGRGIKDRALDIFRRIAEAESAVHGVGEEEVAFHEVGALDSIIDIVGTAVCLEVLAPERITSSAVELGGGTVRCAHGILPVPAPATLRLCEGLPVRAGGFNHEMTTPTGAAILASVVDEFISGGAGNAGAGTTTGGVTGGEAFVQGPSAYGIGSRKLDRPNVLRVSWRETAAAAPGAATAAGEKERAAGNPPWRREELTRLEAAVDDMTGEALGFLMDRLFASGALDVTFTPCVMKKSRPGTIITALCGAAALDSVRKTLFVHSATLGFREIPVTRLSLPRKEEILSGPFGKARQKTAALGGTLRGAEENGGPPVMRRTKIDFEDRARIARENNITLDEAAALIGESALPKNAEQESPHG
ncbi:MAG: nickel pincer cofactor biosynthesis protein LarC [Treponema sp.]|nr:nickel pincer cofactor biosynthesis protein LarC [Treponema sp.]